MTPQVEIRGRQPRAQAAVLVQPEAAKADHQQRQPPLSAQHDGDGPEERGRQRAAGARRVPRQPPGDRQPPVHRAAEGEQDRPPGERDALQQFARAGVGQQTDACQAQHEGRHAQVTGPLRHSVETGCRGVVFRQSHGRRSCHARGAYVALDGGQVPQARFARREVSVPTHTGRRL